MKIKVSLVKEYLKVLILFKVLMLLFSCNSKLNNQRKDQPKNTTQLTAKDILGNPNYLAISYGGYRNTSRDIQPTIDELKEDMTILHAMGIRILRTYNVHLPHAANVLEAIHQLKQENPNFEMYVMLGAWIDCKNAFTSEPDHNDESERNEKEIERTIELTVKYADIVKVIAVGNEAMVKWAWSYYVQPGVILKWVNFLQDQKKEGILSKDLWITSSDNFASWGGGSSEYHVEDLNKLIASVDYISLHTYPMHDTHYNPDFWGITDEENEIPKIEKIEKAMRRAKEYAISQYDSVSNYMKELGIEKPIHIGETGWASYSNGFYGNDGSKATDEFKEALYYKYMRDWTNRNNISCFYFEAFDENWKDAQNEGGSENYFGLFTIEGKAKYALWDMVDNGIFDGLKRGENSISKTYAGDKEKLLSEVLEPPVNNKFVLKN